MTQVRAHTRDRKAKIEAITTRICSIIIPIFQYVPCLSIWRGIMSVPLITYLIFFYIKIEIYKHNINTKEFNND